MILCHFDPFSGISGDMTVGALVDAGADPHALFAALESLGTGARFTVERVMRRGIAAAKFHVEVPAGDKPHRHLHHIEAMIEQADLPARAKQRSLEVFRRLGAAEAQVHGTTIQKVHFHEVGAVDSICDIVGACVALELLGVEEVTCAAVNVGSGVVETEHGLMPVPAPATARLLEGRPVYARGPEMELTTPTGAAIVAALAKAGPLPAAHIRATGFGAGTKDFPPQANVLRVLIAERSQAVESETVTVLETNIDDSTPEVLAYAMERLLAAGALDVAFQPLQMKKNRPGVLVQVVARPEQQEALAAILFAETTTLGVRITTAERRVRERRVVEVDLGYGRVRVKLAGSDAAPEYEDCRALALTTGRPLRQVVAEALAAARSVPSS
jgi:uncharacterized protein (TIGR00299 family) protein